MAISSFKTLVWLGGWPEKSAMQILQRRVLKIYLEWTCCKPVQLNRLIRRKLQHNWSGSINTSILYFADYWPIEKLICFYGLEMRNNAAQFRPYHLSSWSLGTACAERHHRMANEIPRTRSTSRDRRHLQIACFETPIYIDFCARKISNLVPILSGHHKFLVSLQYLRKTHS